MGLTTGTEPGTIARASIDARPVSDSSDFDFVGLQRMASAPPDSGIHPDEAAEARLEAVVVARHEQR